MLGELDRAQIGRDDHRVARHGRGERARQGGHGRQHLHRNAAHGLQRGAVRVHHDQALGTGGRQRVGDHPGTDGLAGPAPAVLPGIPEIRQDRGDSPCPAPAAGIEPRSSSMRWSLTGGPVGWITYTSSPRR